MDHFFYLLTYVEKYLALHQYRIDRENIESTSWLVLARQGLLSVVLIPFELSNVVVTRIREHLVQRDTAPIDSILVLSVFNSATYSFPEELCC